MSIAQRLVAREGETRPAHEESNDDVIDSAALTAFRCDSTNLPWLIFRAAFRAAHIEQLSQRARAVLSALARTVDAHRPFAAIFARRELLTGRAMQSMRTFYRSLADLESAGLIERRPQSRYIDAGLFGRAYLHLTPHAAILLGFIASPATEAPPSVAKSESAPAPDASIKADPSFDHPSAKLAHGAIYKELTPTSFQKRQPGQLPADLQRLRSLGFVEYLIFKLMREAREHGKRLSDVVEATWDHLKLAKAPINYLRALLRSTVDFSHQLRRRMEVRSEEQKRIEQALRADLIAQESAGQTFVDVSGRRKYVVDTDGQSMIVHSVDESIGRQATRWKEQFAAARSGGQIRLASDADLEAFAKARRLKINSTQATMALPNPDKSPVTAQVRDHIASLHTLLRGKRGQLGILSV
jgi:hypothetical protein